MDIEREVQEAIGLLSGKSYGTHNLSCDCVFCKAIDLAITALQAYQSTISKTETDGCDDLYSQCGECGQIYLENRGYDYCPYCGRRLED